MSELHSSAIKITCHLLLIRSVLSPKGNRFHYILLYFMEIQQTNYAKVRESQWDLKQHYSYKREKPTKCLKEGMSFLLVEKKVCLIGIMTLEAFRN